MDNLPQQVTRILSEVTRNCYLSSWRIYGEENIQVTLKFSSHKAGIDTADQYSTGMHGAQTKQYYRSKPPSCVARDQARLLHFQTEKDCKIQKDNSCDYNTHNDDHMSNQPISDTVLNMHDSGIGNMVDHNALLSKLKVFQKTIFIMISSPIKNLEHLITVTSL